MPYQKMNKEEMKVIYQMILEETIMEQGQQNLLLYNFKKLGKEAQQRLQEKTKVKDKRKLKRIFEKFQNSNGEIDKLKNTGMASPYLKKEIIMCELLGANHYKRSVFFKINEEYDLNLPKSNGYLQNYRKRHQGCGITCKFYSTDHISCANSHLSTSCESPLKQSYLSDQDYNLWCSNNSFISWESPFSNSEYQHEFITFIGEETSRNFDLNRLEDSDPILLF